MNLNGRSCRVRVPNKITKYLHAFGTMNITRSLEILYLISCEQNNAQTNNIFMRVLSCTYVYIYPDVEKAEECLKQKLSLFTFLIFLQEVVE